MKTIFAIGIAVAAATFTGTAWAQTEPKVFVAPNKGQSADQQNKDMGECKQSANQQAPITQPQTGPGTHTRGTAGGAARGAAAGAAIGAIAGDAGKGAAIGATAGGVKGRRGSKQQQEAAAAGSANDWSRAFAACMESRGYTVK